MPEMALNSGVEANKIVDISIEVRVSICTYRDCLLAGIKQAKIVLGGQRFCRERTYQHYDNCLFSYSGVVFSTGPA